MEVTLSAQKVAMPEFCGCCGGPPDVRTEVTASRTTGKRVVKTTTSTLSFPYCQRCMAHVEADPGDLGPYTFALTVFTLGLWLVFLLPYRWWARDRARAMMSPTCACLGPAIGHSGWKGTVHTFHFESRPFALEFMRANRAKLVNPDYNALRELDAAPAARMSAPPMYAPPQSMAMPMPPQPVPAQPMHPQPMYPQPMYAPQPMPMPGQPVFGPGSFPPGPSPSNDEDLFVKLVADVEKARGPASRKAALDRGLGLLQQQHLRERLLMESARIEVRAVLDKVDGLKTPAAKRRHLTEALTALRADPVPDHLQAREIAVLEGALRELDATGAS